MYSSLASRNSFQELHSSQSLLLWNLEPHRAIAIQERSFVEKHRIESFRFQKGSSVSCLKLVCEGGDGVHGMPGKEKDEKPCSNQALLFTSGTESCVTGWRQRALWLLPYWQHG